MSMSISDFQDARDEKEGLEDIAYWKPLKQELAELRMNKRSGDK